MDIVSLAIQLFVLLFAITIHEVSHGWTAYRLGDPTAHDLGRLTLNPLAHIDLFGTVLLPLLLVIGGMRPFGWAKPVPVNPNNFRNYYRGIFWVSLAGPAANFAAAFVALLLIMVLKVLRPDVIDFLRVYGAAREALPPGIYPLHGLVVILYMATIINTFLAVLNLIPIFPLDGSGILSALLSPAAKEKYERVRPFSIFIVILVFYSPIPRLVFWPFELLIRTLVFL